jgi:hypothetical protein
MARRFLLLGVLLLATCCSLRAVENSSTGTFNETAPTGISNWQTGWAQPAVQPTGYTSTTGWNYVGSVSGSGSQASGVYLGDGWVITCAHVGAGNFKLNGTTYPLVANSAHTFTGTVTTTTASSSGTTTSSAVDQADFILFQISPNPGLPTLPIRSSDPVRNTSQVVMIGYGDGGSLTNETWGSDTMTYLADQVVNLFSFWTNDFEILNGTNAEYEVVSGDSGGGDFIYNSTASRWELAGLNEAELQEEENNTPVEVGSAFVQLNNSSFSNSSTTSGVTTTHSGTTTYATQIEQLFVSPADTPALPAWALVMLGGFLGLAAIPRILSEQR